MQEEELDAFDKAFDEWAAGPDGSDVPDTSDEDTFEGASDDTTSADVEGDSTDTTSDNPKDSGPIPYARFARVAKERREAREELERLRGQLAEQETTVSTTSGPSVTGDPEVDQILADLDALDESEEYSEDHLAARLSKLERANAKAAFERELDTALDKYPGVSRDDITKEVLVHRGRKSTLEIAKALSDRTEEMTAATVAAFLDANPSLKAAYEASQGKKSTPAPSLKNNSRVERGSPGLRPMKDESGEDFLARLLSA